jgi:NADH-quinone oxidoreductase subunit H
MVVRVRTHVGRSATGNRVLARRLIVAALAGARNALLPDGRSSSARVAPLTVGVAASALFALLPFGQYLVAADLDIALLFVAAVSAVVSASLVGSGSVVAGLRTAAQTLCLQLPAAIAIACVVASTGSLRIEEITGAQGGWPWEWFAFRSPGALLLPSVCFSALLADPSCAAASPLADVMDDAGASSSAAARRPTLIAVADAAHLVTLAGIAAALFFGGWRVPGVSPAVQSSRPSLEMAGAALFLLKTWAIVATVALARWALPRMRMGEMTRLAWKLFVPLSMAAALAAAAWTRWSPPQSAQLIVSVALVALVTLGVAAVAQRVRHGLDASVEAHLNPFL